MKFFNKLFITNPKNKWVKKNVYNYGLSCKRFSKGSFYMSRDKIVCYYNGNTINYQLEELLIIANKMGFEEGFWFLKEKAIELDLFFDYRKKLA